MGVCKAIDTKNRAKPVAQDETIGSRQEPKAVFHLVRSWIDADNGVTVYDIEVEIPFLGNWIFKKFFVTQLTNDKYIIDATPGRIRRLTNPDDGTAVSMNIKKQFINQGYNWRI